MALRRSFMYGSVNSTDYGVYVLAQDVDKTTAKEYEVVSVPGRSGDLHLDKKRFSDVEIVYRCAIPTYGARDFHGFIAALLAEGGSRKIEDTVEPEIYRVGTLTEAVEPRVSRGRDLYVFAIRFACGPQRWLKSGEDAIAVSGTKTINNPTLYTAKPLIRVTGTGTIAIGSDVITITANGGHLVIDCETEDAYNSETLLSYNDKVSTSGNSFPGLAPGSNNVQTTGCTAQVVPRWWTV